MISTVDHRRVPLLDALMQQARADHIRFYMPGHKGGKGSPAVLLQGLSSVPLQADIPELPNLDQLFAPAGVIQEAQALAADAFGATETYFLVNGSSVGLMAALLTLCQPGEAVIIPRHCHQSIVHGLVLSGAIPIWVEPEFLPGTTLPIGITPSQLAIALKQYPQAKAAIAISPTYEGICSDIGRLAAIAHHHGIPLIVDEAHGGHLAFHSDLPACALAQGADLVVQSTHKMLGALTQAAMLHIQGSRIPSKRLRQSLTLLQSSSPSYVLLASLDAARQQMALQGQAILSEAIVQANDARNQLQNMVNMQLLQASRASNQTYQIDPLKLTVLLQNSPLSGFELDHHLSEKHHIVAELPTENHLTFVIGQGNSPQELDTLCSALLAVDHQYPHQPQALQPSPDDHQPSITASRLSPRETFYGQHQTVLMEQGIGQINAKVICPYPPGIPLLFPGEIITEKAIATLERIYQAGGQIIGLPDPHFQGIDVLKT